MRFRREITPAQERMARELGATEGDVRQAAVGTDCFVYVTRGTATVRYQLEQGGGIVSRTVLRRETVVA